MKQIKFTEQEVAALTNLLNIAVKACGFEVAENAIYLAKKIQGVLPEQKAEVAEEKKKS